ncbi:cupin domain-containing protein [Paraburkholderia sp. DHOC27]|uniref:cupin domain-containing protein n=1 Tax=Paraburkholderia sp. DHOC27 TaxID=2303330 RepID=UPI000E3DB10B|nr:cupin domain-containing protein [Paraburkholderia sp. DHOC27]RFU49680.1 hypothetical protein D0B32_07870 [Paraburkholderia sp. DHOC27]
MRSNLIERTWTNLDAAPLASSAVMHLTDPTEAQWVGIVDLAASASYTLEAGHRHDLYVLQGHVEINGQTLEADDFLIRSDASVINAGENGARLLLYREATNSRGDSLVRRASERVWRAGVNPRMHVVPLAGGAQHVSLVAWQPGAHTGDHTHPRGEEIFVLSGELRDAENRYPAGTWLRLHPGARHAPFADTPTTILLRHGHLSDQHA